MEIFNQINTLFNHAGFRKAWCRIRIPVGILAIVGVIPLVRLEWFWLAFGISLFGELVQLWCFATLHKGEELACAGPYACSRNPMYLGRYFIVLGFVLLLGMPGLYLLPFYTVFYWFYMRNRVAREEPHLVKALGSAYEDYCRNVNRFLPSFKGVTAHALLAWNWTWFTRNHGWVNAAALVGVYGALYVIAGVLSQ